MKNLIYRLGRIWISFGHLVHRVMGPLQLALVYYVVLTPVALLMRLFKIDPLRLKTDPKLDSYWIKADLQEERAEQMKYPF